MHRDKDQTQPIGAAGIRQVSRRQALTLAAQAALGTSLVFLTPSRRAAAQKLTQMRMTAGANYAFTNLFVGEAAGIFKKHGFDASVVLFDVSYQGTEAVIAGHAELGITVEFPLVNLLSKGADLVIPAVSASGDDLRLPCLKTIQKPEDLVGKRIGFIFGSNSEYAFDRYLKKYNVDWNKVKMVNVPAAEQVALFVKGDIDGYIWGEPVASRGLEAMAGKAHFLQPGLGTAYTTRLYIEMMRPWVEKNPDAVTNLLRALIECNEFIKNEPQKTAEIAGKKLNMPTDRAADMVKKMGLTWDIYLDSVSIQVFEQVAAWMKGTGRLQGPAPDLRKLFVPEYLRKIDPKLVQGF